MFDIKWLPKNPGKTKQQVYYNKTKWNRFNQILDHYGKKCNCKNCPENRIEFLTLDHINNDGAKHNRKLGGKGRTLAIYEDVIKQGFPLDYQILCHNCNWGKSRYGVCPHSI